MDVQAIKYQFSTEIIKINDISIQILKKLGEVIILFLLQPSQSSNFQENLSEIAVASSLSSVIFKSTAKVLIIVLQSAIQDGLSSLQLSSSLASLGFSNDIVVMLSSLWQQKSSQLNRVLLSRTLATNKLIDMDWSFGVTAASDDADQVGKTYLQVKVKVDTSNGQVKDIFFELTLDQFYSFLAEMEKCKSFLDVISS